MSGRPDFLKGVEISMLVGRFVPFLSDLTKKQKYFTL